MSVRIGIDYRAALADPCGIGRYTRELCRGILSLREDVELVLYAATRFGAMPDRVPRAIREHPRVKMIQRRLPARALRALALIPGFNLSRITGPMALLHHTDLTYLPTEGIPEVITVHDLAFEHSNSFHGAEFRATVGRRVRDAAGRARRIVVPSHVTRNDLIELYGVDGDRIRVIPHGADHVLRRPEDTDESSDQLPIPGGSGRPYLLHVGTIEPRKNLVRLIQAYDKARQDGTDVDLVLAGPRGWMTEAFDQAVADSKYRSSIHCLGPVPELNLRDLYRSALGLVYPSLFEGFGLPVVEAMALGRPVITSDRSSTREVAGDIALLVNPEDVDELSRAMQRLVADDVLQAKLGAAGRKHTEALTWKNTARATLNVYREVMRGAEEPVTSMAT